MATALASVAEIDRELASKRWDAESGEPYQRTSVMTHLAWVPEAWVEAAEDVLAGLAERHPSRTIALFPGRTRTTASRRGPTWTASSRASGGRSAPRRSGSSSAGTGRPCRRASSSRSCSRPAGVPALARGAAVRRAAVRGAPRRRRPPDRRQHRVAGLPGPYGDLADVFERVMVSDIAWARTSRWRPQLASLWPGIAEVKRIKVTGTEAQAYLLAGWLRSRLDREIELEHEPSDRLVSVEVDGEPAPFPPGDPPDPADLLSDELDRFARDRIYEQAVRAA